jgi:hypothetical protein
VELSNNIHNWRSLIATSAIMASSSRFGARSPGIGDELYYREASMAVCQLTIGKEHNDMGISPQGVPTGGTTSIGLTPHRELRQCRCQFNNHTIRYHHASTKPYDQRHVATGANFDTNIVEDGYQIQRHLEVPTLIECETSGSCLNHSTIAEENCHDNSNVLATDKTIEVSPGVVLRLRGADETRRAIVTNFYMPCRCPCCETTLFSIKDAAFVVCPKCRVVSPLEGAIYSGYDGGVGLGFTMEELAQSQNEIKSQRQTNRNIFYEYQK